MRGIWKAMTVAAAGVALAPLAAAAQNRADERAFFDLYKQLVETNTVVGEGSCTRAAQQIATRLKSAGYTDAQVTLFSTPEHPEDGGVVAILPGTDASADAMLLLGHIDVVAAKREDWARDPFKLIEEDGFYYGRGTVDDKGMSAIWADSMIRFKQEGFKPRRTIKLALTCGEETTYAFNGAQWLANNKPDLVRAAFVLNEGGGGRLDAQGKRQALAIQVGEKAAQNFTFTSTNPGGHSSAPTPDNAIYELADAVKRVQGYEFPIKFTDTTRAFFTASAQALPPETGAAIKRLLANPADKRADAVVSRDKVLHSTLRTTCVATLVNAGHAENALPQRATANINCRIFPGESVESTLAKLTELAGPKVTVTANQPVRPIAVPPPLDPRIMGAVQTLAAKHFPGTPVVPMMSTGATDAVFFGVLKMPVYGVPGIFLEPDLNGTHGLNERIRVTALYEGRDYLHDLAKALATQG
ncbi:M20/M25/M40 family metallo-hydrolase [Sphingomonas sp. Ag1]|jgi:acetylornithine deacetylase/succinyl-diaminopimelate desuccinylase-like protein|uniref:M20/M25/M40 family metallo-hydrolase n=1 Tax=Sphingomonas sp. Ag1 TaxID=1642949 RepID=UPI0006224EDD|nr:M20/M25/M40 family metallo-hydrolase [Sphingomonas sp. Ag1]KKI19370.1 peptidase M20 [Sphingomonas sp. Ag1]